MKVNLYILVLNGPFRFDNFLY